MKSFGRMPAVRTPEASPGHSQLRILEFCLPHREIRSAASTTIDFGAMFPFTAVPAGLLPPCLRFVMFVTDHHARLGTRLRARLCRGRPFRRLNSMSFQGATPHSSVRAELLHPAPTSDTWRRSAGWDGDEGSCHSESSDRPMTTTAPQETHTVVTVFAISVRPRL
jgi:hypothetical protein